MADTRMEILGVALVVAGIATALLLGRKGAESRRLAWAEAARRLKLRLTPRSWGQYAITGALGAFSVDMRPEHRGKQGTFTVFRVRGHGAIPATLDLRRQGTLAGVAKALGADDVATGDEACDRALWIRGDPAEVMALLDADTRAIARDEVGARGATVRDGDVAWEVHEHMSDAGAIVDRAERLIDLARRLSLTADGEGRDRGLAARLAGNAASDPLIAVRLRSLRLLQERQPQSPDAIAASRTALRSRTAELRLQGALHLGREAQDAARGIAEGPADAAVRARALAHFAAVAPRDAGAGLCLRLLEDFQSPVRLAAVRSLHRLGHRPALADLVERVADENDPEIRAVLALALGALGDAGAEPALVRLLADEDGATRTAAARGLGSCGTIAAVEPLLAVARGAVLPSEHRRAAREAIDRIQARLEGAEAGRLSIAGESGDGSLSLAAEGGELSPAEPAS